MFKVEFPERRPEVCVETALMERTARRTLAVHPGGALVVWSGPSRVGKTWTARWLRDAIDDAYETSPDAFRAVHYEVGMIADTGTAMKRGVRSLYHATISRITESAYRSASAEDLARQLVYGLQAKNIQMVFVDEAGLLALDAIRGMVLVRDVAEIERHPLTIVFIGMDDLPVTLSRLPQIENRIHEWCYFEAYDKREIYELAAVLHPHFGRLDPDSPDGRRQVDFLYEITHGLPGKLDPFLRKLAQREIDAPGGIDSTFLRAVHLMTTRDRQRTVEDADARRGVGASARGSAGTPREKAAPRARGRPRKTRTPDEPRTARGKRGRSTPSQSDPE